MVNDIPTTASIPGKLSLLFPVMKVAYHDEEAGHDPKQSHFFWPEWDVFYFGSEKHSKNANSQKLQGFYSY